MPKTNAIRAALNLGAHQALAEAVAARKRVEAIDDAPFDSARFRERERERAAAERDRLSGLAVSRSLAQWGEVTVALDALVAALDSAGAHMAEARELTGNADHAREVEVEVAAEVATALLSALYNLGGEVAEGVAGQTALNLGDDDARASALSVLDCLRDAIAPRV